MAQARDEAGNIWEVDEAGNAVRLIQAAQAPQAQGVVMRNPTAANRERRADEDQQFEQRRLQMEQQRLAIAQQQAALDAQRTNQQIQKGDIEIDAALNEAASAPDPRMGNIRQQLQTDNVLDTIGTARQQIGNGWNTGNTFGTKTFQGIPVLGQNATNLSSTLEGLQGAMINDTVAALKAMSASGASGYGSLTEREAQRLAAAISSVNQAQDEETLLASLAKVERYYRNALALLNGEDPRLTEVAEKYGMVSALKEDEFGNDITPTASQSDNSGGGGGGLTADGKWRADPALAGVNSTIRDMLKRGRSVTDVKSYLNRVQPGLGDRTTDLDRAAAFIRQNPGKADTVNIDVEKEWVPASGFSQARGEFAMSPVGSALIGAADTASLGTLDNLIGNPEMARAVMQGLSEENPTSYLLGQLGGGVTTGLGLEFGLGKLGLGGVNQLRAGDALFGAGYGAGSADDPEQSRVANAFLGGATSVAGGMAGRGAGRVVGRAAAGIDSAAQRLLYGADIPMTPGQLLGGGAKAFEDRAAGLPIVGGAINARRQEGLEAFNRAVFDEALAPIGAQAPSQLGAAGVDAARMARSNAYGDALNGVQVQADDVFANDVASLLARSSGLTPDMATISRTTLERNIGDPMGELGQMSGRDLQQSLRGLRRESAAVERQPFGYDVAQINRGGEDALQGLLERQNPGVAAALANANRANSGVETIRTAVNAARNAGEIFTPAQLNTAASQTARRFGNNAGTTNRPFYELGQAAQEVLPNQIPDSGTAGRLMLPFVAGSVAGGGSYAASDEEDAGGNAATGAIIASLLASAPYSKAGRATLEKALMAQRPEWLQSAGQRILSNSELAGLLAAPAAAGYVTQ